MTRSVPYRHQINDVVNWNQIKALNDTLFILREIGPVGFIVQEEGSAKKLKVCLGDPHNCTCKDFRKEKDLCKHICWILLKKYRLDRNDPISWQLGLVQREINDLIFTRRANISKTQTMSTSETSGKDVNKTIVQRTIEPDDTCPICQEDLRNVLKPVTYCRHGCGNNVHIRCMSVWADHKKKELSLKMPDSIPCPICRGDFGTLHTLLTEMTNSKDGKIKKQKTSTGIEHIEISCSNCNASPIIGKTYKCTSCSCYCLCGPCFNSNIHSMHSFSFRETSKDKWDNAPSPRGASLPLAGNGAQNNESEIIDQTMSLPPDRSSERSSLRQQDLNRFSSWTITSKSNLNQPGYQCRICFMSYKDGDTVRKLPRCHHIFHTSCIDPWLLHRSQRCPIDDTEVPKTLFNIQGSKSLSKSVPLNQFIEDRHNFTKQSNNISSALSIASIHCRQSSSSNGHKDMHSYQGNMCRSANNKPHHLPPMVRKKEDFNGSLSIVSMRLHQNVPE